VFVQQRGRIGSDGDLIYGLVLALFLFGAVSRCAEPTADTPQAAQASLPPAEHQVETTAAWGALDAKDYKGAMRHADAVIDKYAPVAARLQQELTDLKETVPSGGVTKQEEEAIHQRGPLNDCAAAYFIKGRASHKLGLDGIAKESFREASRLDGARVWDPKGKFFWSVSGIASRAVDDPEAAEKAQHELITGDAWSAFNKGEFQTAIKHADLCVDQFLSTAKRLEADLNYRKQSFPEGAVGEREKARILANGLLNDTCTCLFIKGQSAEKRGDVKTAIAAYNEAAELTHARCWDPKGWFWNPSQASRDRLDVLR
jgi:tetratricopeptide (TPR) repeat protein